MSEPLAQKDDRREKVYQDPISMVNAYLERFGEEVGAHFDALDGDGYTDVRHAELLVGINVLTKQGLLLLLVKMAECPAEPTSRAAALYRRLLELNFLATQDGAFAVDGARNAIYLRAMRGLAGLDYEEFRELLQNTVAVAEDMQARLAES